MSKHNLKKLGAEIAEKHDWRFKGLFQPANQDVTMLNFEKPAGEMAVITVSGLELLTKSTKAIGLILHQRAGVPKPESRILTSH